MKDVEKLVGWRNRRSRSGVACTPLSAHRVKKHEHPGCHKKWAFRVLPLVALQWIVAADLPVRFHGPIHQGGALMWQHGFQLIHQSQMSHVHVRQAGQLMYVFTQRAHVCTRMCRPWVGGVKNPCLTDLSCFLQSVPSGRPVFDSFK